MFCTIIYFALTIRERFDMYNKRWSNLSVSEQKKYREPDYCEVVLQIAKGEPTLKYEDFPSKYSLIEFLILYAARLFVEVIFIISFTDNHA